MLLIIVVGSIYLKVCLLEPSTVLIQFELGAPHACFTVLTQKFPITITSHLVPLSQVGISVSRALWVLFLDVSYFLRDTLTTCLFEKNICLSSHIILSLLWYRILTSKSLYLNFLYYPVSSKGGCLEMCHSGFWFCLWPIFFPKKVLGNSLYPWYFGISLYSGLVWKFAFILFYFFKFVLMATC